jgi:hypothetical protein
MGIRVAEAKAYIDKVLAFANEYRLPPTWEYFDKMINKELLLVDLS